MKGGFQTKSIFKKSQNIAERLAFLKKRYKKLILEPRKEIESEIEKDLNEEDGIKVPPVDRLYQ